MIIVGIDKREQVFVPFFIESDELLLLLHHFTLLLFELFELSVGYHDGALFLFVYERFHRRVSVGHAHLSDLEFSAQKRGSEDDGYNGDDENVFFENGTR